MKEGLAPRAGAIDCLYRVVMERYFDRGIPRYPVLIPRLTVLPFGAQRFRGSSPASAINR
jgi:hypothetical protein